MPKCIPCLSKRVKKAILDTIDDESVSQILKGIAECPDGVDIDICGRKKRARSEYQEFTSSCMKEDKSMRECAAEWQKQKKEGVQ